MNSLNILIIEDLQTDAELEEREVRQVLPNSRFLRVERREDFLAALTSFRPDVILSDFKLPEFDGMSALKLALAHVPETPFIIVTGSMNEETAVDCMKAGAWDYIIKEHVRRLGPAVMAVLEQKKLRRERKIAEETLQVRNRELMALTQFSLGLISIQSGQDMYAYIARSLRDMTGGATATFGLFDPVGKAIHVKHAEYGPGVMNDLIRSLGGKQITETVFQVNDDLHRELLQNPIGYRSSLSEVTFGVVPELLGRIVQKIQGINRFLGIVYLLDDKLYGTSVVALHTDTPDPPTGIVQLFAQMVTLSLRRVCTEESLRQSDAKFSMAFQTSPYAITITHMEDRKLLEVNDAFTQLTGFTREEAITEDEIGLKLWVNEEDRQHVLTALRSGRTITSQEYLFRTKSDKILTCLFSARMIHLDQGPCILSSISDISDRKRSEKEHERLTGELHQAQKMESIGRLAGGVAHDFNNMLNVIIGYAELAKEKVAPEDPLHSDLMEIVSAGRRSTEITRQLLAFARKQAISPEVIDLNETVGGMLKMLRRLIGENIDLAWLPGSCLWPVLMDPSQLDQILANLCVNARDAISDVGKLTIETVNVIVDAAYCADHAGFAPGDFVLLTVSDTGSGMDWKIRERIFEPFFTTKESGKGTGLGLATVYGIVRQHNGFIHVYSEPGQGTAFKIYLPRHQGTISKTPETSVAEIPAGRGETILIVEDETAVLKLARTILDKTGYTVLTAETPDAAIRLAEKHAGRIHLLITDVILPGMNGRDLAARLQAIIPSMKCLFMSGYTADAITQHGVLEKNTHFLPKPFSVRTLTVKVRDLLSEA